MIDKSKPFYIVRSPVFGAEGWRHPGTGQWIATPPLQQPKATLDEAKNAAIDAASHGKSFDVYELRLVGRVGPPAPVWQPVKKPRRVRKAKRKVRK